MKALHVLLSLAREYGGPARSVPSLVRALQGRGVECDLFVTDCFRGGHDVPTDDLRVRRFPCSWPRRFWRGYSPALGRALRSVAAQYDVVHVHELFHQPHLEAYRAARRSRRPFVISPRGMLEPWALRHRGLKKAAFLRLFQTRILERATAVHALTVAEAAHVHAVGPRSAVTVVPNGIATAQYDELPARTTIEARYPELAGRTVVLFFSRIHPKKGLDALVPAFARVVQARGDTMLVVAGPDEGGYGATVQAMVDGAGIASRVRFTGSVHGDVKRQLLSRADIFVLPSYSEGFSMATLEAMASGLPVIISRQCYFPEVERAGAGLVTDTSDAALAAALLRLVDEPALRRQMGRSARELVRRRYDWDCIAADMVSMYEAARTRVASESGQRPAGL